MKETLEEFYRSVDSAAAALAEVHAERLKCAKGCSSCCVDGITVFEVEAENIRKRHPSLLGSGAPHPPGACAFLDDEGACRIYADRPYVCRTQGLPFRWFGELEDEIVEFRDICPLNDEGDAPLEDLKETECWTIGEFEGRLARIASDRNKARRLPLRALFDEPSNQSG